MFQAVYTPKGEMFEVPASKVTSLIHKGWTLTYPEDLSTVFMTWEPTSPLTEPATLFRPAQSVEKKELQ